MSEEERRRKDEFDDEGSGDEPDSSDEDDEDDEEEMQRVRDGFIVDDEEEEIEDDEDRIKKKKKRRKRHHSEEPTDVREDNGQLDEDDLDLLMENAGLERDRREFKRLKRADEGPGGLDRMFSDEEEEQEEAPSARRYQNEFDDFIEEDELSDDERRRQEEQDIRSSNRASAPTLAAVIPGIDDEKMGDIMEIFGNGEDYDWALEGEDEMDAEDEDKVPELKDVFEPSELKARLLTDEDNAIRVEDTPERYQLLRQACKLGYDLADDELLEEQNWIKEKVELEKRNMLDANPMLIKPLHTAVRDVVEFVVKESYDIPHIWHNRADYISVVESGKPREYLLTRDDLWRILDLDIEFHALLEKKKAAVKIYEDMDLTDLIFTDNIQLASQLVEYQDMSDYLQFRYSREIQRAKAEQEVKRHSRFKRFERLRGDETYSIVEAIGIQSHELAENIEADSRMNHSIDSPKHPLELAKEFTGLGKLFRDPQQALEESEVMFAEEIFYDPKIRRIIRKRFVEQARVDIILTDKGLKRIDSTSPYYDFKYAVNRTFEELRLKPDLYLRMLQAESEGLVTVRISYPHYKTTLFVELLKLFQSDGVSEVAEDWNTVRLRVLKRASRKLVPLICRNIKEDLRQDCQRSLYFEVRNAFAEKLDQAGYKPPQFEVGSAQVLAVSAGMGEFGRDSVLAVLLDENGQVVNSFKFDTDPREVEFRDKFASTVRDAAPDVICMAGFTVNSAKLHGIIRGIIDDSNLVCGESNVKLELIWAQDEVARLFQNSQRAEIELSGYTPLARYCIALARYVQSPLLEYAALGPEISAIHIHPHQLLLPAEMFQSAVESCFVDYVNTIGVDINEASRNSYIANLLQYVSGLGPRKASGVLQQIQTRGGIASRHQLIIDHVMAAKTWVNAASFLRFPIESKSSKTMQGAESLDSTRIHPEDYDDARSMAQNAFDYDEEDVQDLENNGGLIYHVCKKPKVLKEKLDQLDLLQFSDKLAKEDGSGARRKLLTLYTIKDELISPYKELRKPLSKMTELKVFTMLTGETKDSLATGAVVPVTVRKVSDRFLAVRLASGIDGTVAGLRMDVGQSRTIQFGSTIPAVVVSVDYGNFTAELSTRREEIEHGQKAKAHRFDKKKWNYEAEDKELRLLKAEQDNEQKSRRIVKHQFFRLLDSKQAEQWLAPKGRGELVIRPSSRGPEYLAITWKVAENIYQHLAVMEVNKPSEFEMGQFQVGNETFSDLDELILEYVQGLAARVDEMENSSKFVEYTDEQVRTHLNTYCSTHHQSQYAFIYDRKSPGNFLLYFKISDRAPIVLWKVRVVPKGYQLQDKVFPTVNELCNGFKRMYVKLAAQQQQQR